MKESCWANHSLKCFNANAKFCRATSLIPQGDAYNEEQTSTELQNHHTEAQLTEMERIDRIIPDKLVTDEEIADLLSGEAEVLQDGVIG